MRKKILCLSLSLLVLFLSALPMTAAYAEETESYESYYAYENPSTGYGVVFNDQAGFLSTASSEEINDFYALLQSITDYCNVDFETTTFHYSDSAEDYITQQTEKNFGYGNNSIGFVIDRNYNEIYLISEGSARRQLGSRLCSAICDTTYIYATSSRGYDYYTCAYETYSQILTTFEGRRISAPFRVITGILTALAIGMIICYFIAKANSRQKLATRQQILKGTFTSFKVTDTNALLVNQTRTYSPPASSGGGGGGGGGHSGGGGGGGGHSGGGHGI